MKHKHPWWHRWFCTELIERQKVTVLSPDRPRYIVDTYRCSFCKVSWHEKIDLPSLFPEQNPFKTREARAEEKTEEMNT